MVVIFTLFREYYIIEDKFPADGLCWQLRSHNPTMSVNLIFAIRGKYVGRKFLNYFDMIYTLWDLQQRQRTVRNVTIRRTQLYIGVCCKC